jgi:hypothetical protein
MKLLTLSQEEPGLQAYDGQMEQYNTNYKLATTEYHIGAVMLKADRLRVLRTLELVQLQPLFAIQGST